MVTVSDTNTTIDASGTLGAIYIGAEIVIQRDASSPDNDPVVVTLNTGLLNAIVDSTFMVQNSATMYMGGDIVVGALDQFIIGQSGTMEVGQGINVSLLNDISFETGASGGYLIVDSGVDIALLDNISGFASGDTIDFAGTNLPASATSYSDIFDGTYTDFSVLLQGNTTASFALFGNLTGDTFSLGSVGGVDFTITDLGPDVACFAAGTRLLTDAGEVPVENLAVGDTAILHDGTAAPIIFIGHRRLDLRRHPNAETVCPVRIAAGALADGIPGRDLILSPDHALLLDGVLVQAKDLVDGVAITQDFGASSIRYYHVELPAHGILLAEGTPAESYLDTGHRALFENSGGVVILHPNLMQMRREAESVAPLCTSGATLAAIRNRLHARKLAAGLTIGIDWTITARTATATLTPVTNGIGHILFALPDNTEAITLHIPAFTPAAFDPGSDDRRRLGLAIADIQINGCALPLETLVTDGLHPRSAGDPHVWTRDELALTLPKGAKTLSLTVAGRPKTWRPRHAA
jgi:hypothetical protein